MEPSHGNVAATPCLAVQVYGVRTVPNDAMVAVDVPAVPPFSNAMARLVVVLAVVRPDSDVANAALMVSARGALNQGMLRVVAAVGSAA